MADALTESFCERCGTRYTFESVVPRSRLHSLKVVSRGLRTFVLDDKTSLEEALASARNDTDRDASASQLDAFHQTFNFCMQCRQYTCPNCWNQAEGRCLTCAPMGSEAALRPLFPPVLPALKAIPASTLTEAPEVAVVEVATPADVAVVADVAAVADVVAADPEIVEPDIAAVVSEPDAEAVVLAAAAAARTKDLFATFRPGQDIDAALAAYEATIVEAEPVVESVVESVVEPEPEPVVELVAEPEPVVAEPEPVVAGPEPEPEPVVELVAEPEPEPEPVAAAAPEPEAPTPIADDIEQPTWTIPTPEPEPVAETPALPVAATIETPRPAAPQWPAQRPAVGLPFLNRPAVPTGGVEALWAASNLEVASPAGEPKSGGVQPCVSCGLSLSATARFCRRCGSPQGG